ncbi:hypothetical protein GCM10009430_32740 [Aquimarina litoralis]|uniref:F5/8 type C domain-containing protein n=2 Tax=Aquimarina litoralis TaxID=584605 RepID=A0ABP3UBI3_9FLAO
MNSQGINAVNASSSLWPKKNVIDRNKNTVWSSKIQPSPTNKQWISIQFNKAKKINFVKLSPRYINGLAYGFPKSFVIRYRNNSRWINIRTENNFPRARRGDFIILPLSKTITTNSIQILATVLGNDNEGNNVFQLAEFNGGFHQHFQSRFKYIGGNSPFKSRGTNEIRNVGSSNFNPNKLNVWHYDIRKPLMNNINAPNYYSPSIVKNGKTWNIYYGGFDFANYDQDNIYLTTSNDDFLSFKGKSHVISNVNYRHANNCSVIKQGNSDWKMLYTAYPLNGKNKPHYGTSTNGGRWVFNKPITMSNYPRWAQTNSDGGNVLYFENGTYHLYFTDYNYPDADFRVHHATSTNFIDYKYKGVAKNIDRIATDMKAFRFNNRKYYLLGTHRNISNVQLTVSTNLNSFDKPFVFERTLPTSNFPKDKNIATLGFVTNGNRLYGYMYGSSFKNSLTDNKIYANWLQKKVIFQNKHVRWGDQADAYGPNRVELYMNTQIETGNFYIYDSDGTTLLYKSPLVTMKSGDIWHYLNNNKSSDLIVDYADDILEDGFDLLEPSINHYVTNNSVYLETNEDIQKIEIYGITGSLLKSVENNDKYINIDGLNTGIYILKVYTDSNSHTLKFIIDK